MPKLSWINDENLHASVKVLLDKAEGAKLTASKKFNSNVIDPFSAIFEMSGFKMGYDDWVKSEEIRQSQKTLQNFVGEFHQTILGSCDGWENMHTGSIVDLVNKEKKIVVELKNKYNTISGGKLADLYKSLDDAVMPKTSIYKGFTAYYAVIIPQKPIRFNIPFTPSNKDKGQKCATNQLIRNIDGASFYALVTGKQNALEKLFEVIPKIIIDIKGENILDTQRLKVLFNLAYKGKDGR